MLRREKRGRTRTATVSGWWWMSDETTIDSSSSELLLATTSYAATESSSAAYHHGSSLLQPSIATLCRRRRRHCGDSSHATRIAATVQSGRKEFTSIIYHPERALPSHESYHSHSNREPPIHRIVKGIRFLFRLGSSHVRCLQGDHGLFKKKFAREMSAYT